MIRPGEAQRVPLWRLGYGFYIVKGYLKSIFTARGYTVHAMNSMMLRARQMSLALLVVAVVDHGQVQADYSGATPTSSGLLRLGRDLMRRAGGEGTIEVSASEWATSRNRRTRPLTA